MARTFRLIRKVWVVLLVAVACAIIAGRESSMCSVVSASKVQGSEADLNFDSAADVVLNMKHRLGRIKSAMDSGDLDKAMQLIKMGQGLLSKWGLHIQKKIKARDNPESSKAIVKEDPVEFNIKVTHVPKNCKFKSAEGDTLKVHFVGKLLKDGKKGKAFDSSFHTGSMPYKFVLGSGGGAKVEGWNEGLLDMCQGERRTLTIPWTEGFGEEGRPSSGIPPYANLKYMIELVELRSGGRRRSRRDGL